MIQKTIKEGKIVPSEIILKLLQKAMKESGNDKFLIDAFLGNEENRVAILCHVDTNRRPQEIVETKSEITEEEVGDGWSMEAFNEEKGLKPFSYDSSPRSHSPWNPFQGTDPFSRGLSDGFEGFVQAAEEMMNEAFNQLGFYKEDEESIRHHSGRPRKMFPDTRSKGKYDSSSAEDNASKKVDFGDSRSFDEV
ncbi:hypothetical protein L7F22_038099 [Adiantum nelumboides]|nr:hypothetical protein [Adiantum nelumboides]